MIEDVFININLSNVLPQSGVKQISVQFCLLIHIIQSSNIVCFKNADTNMILRYRNWLVCIHKSLIYIASGRQKHWFCADKQTLCSSHFHWSPLSCTLPQD